MSRRNQREKEVEPDPPVCKSKKEAKKLFTDLGGGKNTTIKEKQFVDGLWELLKDLDNPAYEGEKVTRGQLQALWRTLEVADTNNDGIGLKEFQGRFTVPLEIKKESRRKKGDGSGRAGQGSRVNTSHGHRSRQKQNPNPRNPCGLSVLQGDTDNLAPPKGLLSVSSKDKKVDKKTYEIQSLMGVFHVGLEAVFDNTRVGARRLYKLLLTSGMDVKEGSEEPEPLAEDTDLDTPLPPLSRKHFIRAMQSICRAEREKAEKQQDTCPFWASGRTGMFEKEFTELFKVLDKRDHGKTDEEYFAKQIVLEEALPDAAPSGGKGDEKKGDGKDSKETKRPRTGSSRPRTGNRPRTGGGKDGKDKAPKWRKLVGITQVFVAREEAHAASVVPPDYTFKTVPEKDMLDFANDIILNCERAKGIALLCEPPLLHWDSEDLASKAINTHDPQAGYKQLLFKPKKTQLKKIIWDHVHSGPILFCKYFTSLTDRSQTEWSYNCKLYFNNKEQFIKMESNLVRTLIDQTPYDDDPDQMGFADWEKYVGNEDDSDYEDGGDAPVPF